jgi:hypothetical protein
VSGIRQISRSSRQLGWLAGCAAIGLAVVLAVFTPAARVGAQDATATPTPYVYQDSDPYLIYEGNWNLVRDAKAMGGSTQQARSAGSRLIMQFRGPYVKIFSVYGPNKGRVRITIDGQEIPGGTIDLYRPGDPVYELIVWRGGLDDTKTYTLVVEVLGQRNGASSDSLVDIDAIEVLSAERPPITPTPTVTPTATHTPAPTATPSATPIVGAQPGVGTGADKPAGSWPIDSRFLRYYVERDGLRVLGNTMSPPTFFAGRFTQYFEKGRMEDHTGEHPDPNWQFQYGLLVDELQTARVPLTVGGEVSTITYATINTLAQAAARIPPPANFNGGTATNSDGSVFVPYSQALQPAPGHNISPIFWPFMNRRDIFPGGWLHDIGLPMTEAIPAVVTKGTLENRQIYVQVFQRTILTYDPLNPADFQVERANVGTDYRRAFPDRVPQ